ncbi:MAG: histidine kinase dimerization/phospho-acceptor domain-containing protein, partial [bacterium]
RSTRILSLTRRQAVHEDTIDDLQSRLLFLVGYPRDAKLTQDVLDATGIAVAACPDMDSLATEVERGASAVILPEERLAQIHGTRFFDWLQHQPPWSDLPILIVAHSGDSSVAINQAMEFLGNTTILERPMRITSLVSAVRTALRARQKQYQVRDLLKNLHEADNKKDEFLAVLSHELRNPLAPIRSALEILKLDDSLTPSSRELTGLMERQVNHMVRLVDDLLEISRLTRGKIDLRLETVDMVSVLMSAVETSKPIIESRGHTLDLSIQAGRQALRQSRPRAVSPSVLEPPQQRGQIHR